MSYIKPNVSWNNSTIDNRQKTEFISSERSTCYMLDLCAVINFPTFAPAMGKSVMSVMGISKAAVAFRSAVERKVFFNIHKTGILNIFGDM